MGPVKVYIPAYDIQPLSMTLDVRAKILPETHCLIMLDICYKLFENPSLHAKVTAQTRNSGYRNGQTGTVTEQNFLASI